MYTLRNLEGRDEDELIDIILGLQEEIQSLKYSLDDKDAEVREVQDEMNRATSVKNLPELLYEQSKEVGVVRLRQIFDDAMADLNKYYA